MELQQLKYMVALSQEHHFSRAARRANVTQPTLSQQLKKMENELGIPLFERSSRGVKLTPAGERFLPYALATLDSLEKGVAALQEESGKIAGRIKIGAIPTIAPYLMPQILVALRRRALHLAIDVYEETTSLLLESLKAGKIDVGILSLPIEDPTLISKSLGKEEFFLAVGREHPLGKKKWVVPKDIKNEKLLILQEGHCFSEQALEYCKRLRQDTEIVFQGSSLVSVMKLAAAGEGITFVPKMAVDRKENPSLIFIPFVRPKPSREVGIVWRISAPITNAHRYLMEITERIFKIDRF